MMMQGTDAMMTDPIADMLTRIRNAVRVERPHVTMPLSKVKRGLAEVLKREGLHLGLGRDPDRAGHQLRLHLKYGPNGERVIRHVRRVSKPGRRIYSGAASSSRCSTAWGFRSQHQPRRDQRPRSPAAEPRRRSALRDLVSCEVTVVTQASLSKVIHVAYRKKTRERARRREGRRRRRQGRGRRQLGKLELEFRPEVSVKLRRAPPRPSVVSRKADDRQARALHGLTRALMQNMVVGRHQGL